MGWYGPGVCVRSAAASSGGRARRSAARASVCIRHIYPDSGRAGSLTRPNARLRTYE